MLIFRNSTLIFICNHSMYSIPMYSTQSSKIPYRKRRRKNKTFQNPNTQTDKKGKKPKKQMNGILMELKNKTKQTKINESMESL